MNMQLTDEKGELKNSPYSASYRDKDRESVIIFLSRSKRAQHMQI